MMANQDALKSNYKVMVEQLLAYEDENLNYYSEGNPSQRIMSNAAANDVNARVTA